MCTVLAVIIELIFSPSRHKIAHFRDIFPSLYRLLLICCTMCMHITAQLPYTIQLRTVPSNLLSEPPDQHRGSDAPLSKMRASVPWRLGRLRHQGCALRGPVSLKPYITVAVVMNTMLWWDLILEFLVPHTVRHIATVRLRPLCYVDYVECVVRVHVGRLWAPAVSAANPRLEASSARNRIGRDSPWISNVVCLACLWWFIVLCLFISVLWHSWIRSRIDHLPAKAYPTTNKTLMRVVAHTWPNLAAW